MCGRYYVNDDTAREIEKLLWELLGGRAEGPGTLSGNPKKNLIRGDIHPADLASVIDADADGPAFRAARWGFVSPKSAGLLINARSESVLEKKTFAESVGKRRCLIPAAGFYEWDSDKNKVAFSPRDAAALFMAGCWDVFSDERRFVILTTTANSFTRAVHDRMPLLLSGEESKIWLDPGNGYQKLLRIRPKTVLNSEGYYQEKFLF